MDGPGAPLAVPSYLGGPCGGGNLGLLNLTHLAPEALYFILLLRFRKCGAEFAKRRKPPGTGSWRQAFCCSAEERVVQGAALGLAPAAPPRSEASAPLCSKGPLWKAHPQHCPLHRAVQRARAGLLATMGTRCSVASAGIACRRPNCLCASAASINHLEKV